MPDARMRICAERMGLCESRSVRDFQNAIAEIAAVTWASARIFSDI
jgi:hypothetical protein